MKNLSSFAKFLLNEQEDLNPDKLKFGDKDKDPSGPVHKLQQRLIDKGLIDITKPTGYFGDVTKRALEEAGKKWDAILVGGLDYRPGDYNIDQQVKMLKKSLGPSKNIKGFRYNVDTNAILKFLEKNPKLPIYLFSAGCNKADTLSANSNVDKSKIYIIEPYAVSGNKNVSDAVAKGVPSKNVFAGPDTARGKGVVKGSTDSPGKTHWDSLIAASASTV